MKKTSCAFLNTTLSSTKGFNNNQAWIHRTYDAQLNPTSDSFEISLVPQLLPFRRQTSLQKVT